MALDRVRALWRKENIEIRRNKMVLGAMAAMPVIFVAMILVSDYFLLNAGAGKEPKGFVPPAALAHLGPRGALAVLLNDQYMFYLLMMAIILPTMIAAYSVIGEKQARTLEPLLATPLTTGELLMAKAWAAALPSTLITWIAYGLTAGGIYLVGGVELGMHALRPLWLLGFLLLGPLLALFSALLALIISTRVTDVRVAQGLAGMTVLPLVGVGTYVILANKYLTLDAVLIGIAALVPLDLALLGLAVKTFGRESIICRWK